MYIVLTNKIRSNCDIEIFTGDININLLNTDNVIVGSYIDCLSEIGYSSVINKATRVVNDSSSCIDHFFIKHKKDITAKGIILLSGLTDHYPILLNVPLLNNNVSSPNKKYVSKLCSEKLYQMLKNEVWDDVVSLNSVDECTNVFILKLKNYVNQATSAKYVCCKKRIIKPWITQALLISIRQRDKLRKLVAKNPNNPNLLNNFKAYRNLLTKLTNKAKTSYFKQKFEQHKNNSKKTWELIRKASNENFSNNLISCITNDDGTELSEEKAIANKFNDYFSTVGNVLEANIKKPPKNNVPRDELIIPESLFLRPISQEEIINVIHSLKNTPSAGEDGLKSELFKSMHIFLLKPLKDLINLIFEMEVFPQRLKKTIITPLYKSGPKKIISNYRPISITNNLSKIVEKCIKLRLDSYLDQHKIISDAQFGFRQGLGTEDAVLKLSETIAINLEKNRKCLAVFLDLAKAFDTVTPHPA